MAGQATEVHEVVLITTFTDGTVWRSRLTGSTEAILEALRWEAEFHPEATVEIQAV